MFDCFFIAPTLSSVLQRPKPPSEERDAGRFTGNTVAIQLLRAVDGRLVLAVDVTSRLCSEAHTAPQGILCRTYGRGKDQHMTVPGWPYRRAAERWAQFGVRTSAKVQAPSWSGISRCSLVTVPG
jgi:hypothetical protein